MVRRHNVNSRNLRFSFPMKKWKSTRQYTLSVFLESVDVRVFWLRFKLRPFIYNTHICVQHSICVRSSFLHKYWQQFNMYHDLLGQWKVLEVWIAWNNYSVNSVKSQVQILISQLDIFVYISIFNWIDFIMIILILKKSDLNKTC